MRVYNDGSAMHACIYLCTILDEFVSELVKNLQSASELFNFSVSCVGNIEISSDWCHFFSLTNSSTFCATSTTTGVSH